MTISDFLSQRPIHFTTSLASIKHKFREAGGQLPPRYELYNELGRSGLRLAHTKLGLVVTPDRPTLPASTVDGWIKPSSLS